MGIDAGGPGGPTDPGWGDDDEFATWPGWPGDPASVGAPVRPTAPPPTAPPATAPHDTAPHDTAPHDTAPHDTAPHAAASMAAAPAVTGPGAAPAGPPGGAGGGPAGTGGEARPAGPLAHPARLALGVVLLAADRVRARTPSDTFVIGVGLAQQTVDEMRGLARRALGPPGRAASRTLDWASRQAGVAANAGLFGRTRGRVGRLVDDARAAGRATIAAGREDAATFVRSTVADGMEWAETQAVPRIVDSLVPHLVDSVVPRLLTGVMPEIRNTVLPTVVDDLANDPRVRDLVMEQSRGVIGEAAEHVRSATASADTRVEAAFRRLMGAGPERQEPPTPGDSHAATHDG